MSNENMDDDLADAINAVEVCLSFSYKFAFPHEFS